MRRALRVLWGTLSILGFFFSFTVLVGMMLYRMETPRWAQILTQVALCLMCLGAAFDVIADE